MAKAKGAKGLTTERVIFLVEELEKPRTDKLETLRRLVIDHVKAEVAFELGLDELKLEGDERKAIRLASAWLRNSDVEEEVGKRAMAEGKDPEEAVAEYADRRC